MDDTPSPYFKNDYPELWLPPAGAATDYISRMYQPTTADNQLGTAINRSLDRYYPHAFINPDNGRLLVLGSSAVDDPLTSGTNYQMNPLTLAWSGVYPYDNGPQDDVPNTRRDYPSAVMVDGIIIKCGGTNTGEEGSTAQEAVDHACFMKLTDAYGNLTGYTKNQWYKAPDTGTTAGKMVLSRKNHTLVALPDGKVIAFGGNTKRNNPDNQNGNVIVGAEDRTQPEMFDLDSPNSAWALLKQPISTERIGRPYHSVALLLPDARVIVAGGEQEFGMNGFDNDKQTMQIFAPPYGGNDLEADWRDEQPTITLPGGASTMDIAFGTTFNVSLGAAGLRSIDKVCLISLGSTTHAFNANQQFIYLHRGHSANLSQGSVTLTAPTSTDHCRPGYYMMFAVDENGIPSNAKIVRLRDYDAFGLFKAVMGENKGTTYEASSVNQVKLSENRDFGFRIIPNSSHDAEVVIEAVGDHEKMTKFRIDVECRSTVSGQNPTLTCQVQNIATNTWETVGTSTVTSTEQVHRFTSPTFAQTGDYFQLADNPFRFNVRLRWSSGSAYSVKMDSIKVGVRP